LDVRTCRPWLSVLLLARIVRGWISKEIHKHTHTSSFPSQTPTQNVFQQEGSGVGRGRVL